MVQPVKFYLCNQPKKELHQHRSPVKMRRVLNAKKYKNKLHHYELRFGKVQVLYWADHRSQRHSAFLSPGILYLYLIIHVIGHPNKKGLCQSELFDTFLCSFCYLPSFSNEFLPVLTIM